MTVPNFHNLLLPSYRRKLRDHWGYAGKLMQVSSCLSPVTPKECNDLVSKMLTAAEPGPVPGSTTEKSAWSRFQGSRWQHLQLSPSSLLSLSPSPLLQSPNTAAFKRNPFYADPFTCVECKNQWSCNLLHFYSFNCRADKDCRMFIHMWGSWRMMRWQRSLSHLTIVPGYLKSLLNGRLQKAESSRDAREQEHCSHLDPSNSTVRGLDKTYNGLDLVQEDRK